MALRLGKLVAKPDRETIILDTSCALRYLHGLEPNVVHGDMPQRMPFRRVSQIIHTEDCISGYAAYFKTSLGTG
jgi:hypothetical protein